MTDRHRYERDLSADDGSSLAQLARWVPRAARVLELGPASGYFTRHLREQLDCTVDAVELDPAMAERARPWCRKLVVGDLATLKLAEHFERGAYDRIIVADVIEHVAEPEPVLRQLVELLAPAGEMLLSVPNVAYAGLVAALAEGRWDYGDEGLLDRTHLRFYTRYSLAALLADAGLQVHAWGAVVRSLYDSEFRGRVETLPPALRDWLDRRPDALAYQWLVRAARGAPTDEPTVPEARLAEVERFPVRLFWAAGDAPFDYSRSAVQWALIGADRQTVSFDLVAADALRVRLADRPGFVALHDVALLDATGAAIWQSAGESIGPAAFEGAELAWNAPGSLTLLGTESWIAPRCGAEVVRHARRLRLELGWPMSSDYRVAQRGWTEALRVAEERRVALEALIAARDDALARRNEEVGRLEGLVAERDAWLVQRHAHIDHLERIAAERDEALGRVAARIAALEEDLAARARLVAERDAWLAQRHEHIVHLERLVVERDGWLAQRHEHIAHLERLVAERDAQLAGLTLRVTALEQQVAAESARATAIEGQREQAQAEADAQAQARREERAEFERVLAARDASIAEMRSLRWWALRPFRVLRRWLFGAAR